MTISYHKKPIDETQKWGAHRGKQPSEAKWSMLTVGNLHLSRDGRCPSWETIICAEIAYGDRRKPFFEIQMMGGGREKA